MKRNITFIVVIGVVSAFYSCASHEPRFRIPGTKILSQSDMEQLFYAERTVKIFRFQADLPLSDITQTGGRKSSGITAKIQGVFESKTKSSVVPGKG